MYLVYIICKNEKEAKKIALALLKKRFIACANVVPKIHSMYWWGEKIQSSAESLLLCKTSKEKISSVKKEVKKMHSHKVPCIDFFKIVDADSDYLQWLKKELKTN